MNGARGWMERTELAAVGLVSEIMRRLSDGARRLRRDEEGQTPTEYLMIVGLMAVVIITVFVIFYWSSVSTSAKTWVANVKQAVTGAPIKP
ncbi:MAG: hypothetical protein HYX76_08615 [Acidobacteria bacterium]|nr:hypothetical protein [Acidobacteriota bacterium]